MCGSDHAHARATLPAQIGEDRSFDVGTDLGPASCLPSLLARRLPPRPHLDDQFHETTLIGHSGATRSSEPGIQ